MSKKTHFTLKKSKLENDMTIIVIKIVFKSTRLYPFNTTAVHYSQSKVHFINNGLSSIAGYLFPNIALLKLSNEDLQQAVDENAINKQEILYNYRVKKWKFCVVCMFFITKCKHSNYTFYNDIGHKIKRISRYYGIQANYNT